MGISETELKPVPAGFSHRTGEHMSKQEPHAFRKGGLLGKQTPNQSNEGASTIIHG
jgi:hypothetical protein